MRDYHTLTILRRIRRGRPRTAALAALLALAVVLPAACSGGGGSSSGSAANGGTLTVVSETDTDSLDPQKVTAIQAAMMLDHVYDTLVAVGYDQRTLYPLLAEKWEISKDGLTYTFQLRKDVTFWSGKKFGSDDVVATLDRLRDPKFGSTSEYYMDAVKSIDAPDANTVVLKLKHPDSWLMQNLSMPFASMLNADRLKKYGADYGKTPDQVDGTGPFKIESWQPKNQLTMTRNAKYKWGPSFLKNRGPAHVDKIVWKEVPEASTRIQGLQSGDADITPATTGLEPFVKQAKGDASLKMLNVPSYNIQWLGFKMKKPMQSDVRVRQALSYAINKKAIVDAVLLGQGTVAHSFLDAAMPDYWKSLDTNWYNYDVQRAKQLLDDAGWVPGPDGVRAKNGTKLVLNVYAGTESKDALTLIQQDYRKIGVKMVQNLVDRTTLYAIRATEKPDLNFGWVAYPNADQVLKFYFACGNQPSPNRFNYCSKDTDKDFADASAALSVARRNQAYIKSQQNIFNDDPAVPLYHVQLTMITSSKVQGVRPYPLYNIGLYKSTDITVGH
jgi:peptide/nickel transport system substrate-binding protein